MPRRSINLRLAVRRAFADAQLALFQAGGPSSSLPRMIGYKSSVIHAGSSKALARRCVAVKASSRHVLHSVSHRS